MRELFANERVTAYIGFDPTASSLHVGSLLPIMALARLQRFGHSPIAVVGGGTGMIGDPSGKTQERPLLTREQVERERRRHPRAARAVPRFRRAAQPRAHRQQRRLARARSICIEFLRDVGKHFTVNYMLQKESVKRRLESEEGISYTEFSYLLLQAYDFLELFDRYSCTLQMGGSDQWGNITAGMDLIRKLRGAKAHGLVLPLVTTAAGAKFGKTEAGAIWLDPERTSPFEFYQFWLNTDDRDVGAVPEVLHVSRPRDAIEALEPARQRPGEAGGAARAGARGDDAGARRRTSRRAPSPRTTCCLVRRC